MTPQQMAELHAQCFQTPRPWSAQEFTRLVAMKTHILSTHAHGFAIAQVSAPSSELLTIAVAPDHRRQGIGDQLLCDLIAQTKARGASDMILDVAFNNDSAISLYKRFGFFQIGQRLRYYRTPDGATLDALVLQCGFR